MGVKLVGNQNSKCSGYSITKILSRLYLPDKDWGEKNLIWFIEVFGLDKLIAQPFISPSTDNFPYKNLEDPSQFELLFQQLCRYWDVNRDEIIVKLFDDVRSKQ